MLRHFIHEPCTQNFGATLQAGRTDDNNESEPKSPRNLSFFFSSHFDSCSISSSIFIYLREGTQLHPLIRASASIHQQLLSQIFEWRPNLQQAVCVRKHYSAIAYQTISNKCRVTYYMDYYDRAGLSASNTVHNQALLGRFGTE